MTGRHPHVASFRDLIVYQKARAVTRRIFELTEGFAKEEMYSLTDQIRRSSRSVGAQIAEAWGKRRYVRHFESKLTGADAEQMETQHWLDAASDCAYISESQCTEVVDELGEIGRMLQAMINRSDTFCNPQNLREDEELYRDSDYPLNQANCATLPGEPINQADHKTH